MNVVLAIINVYFSKQSSQWYINGYVYASDLIV